MGIKRSRRMRTERKDIEISLTPLIDTTLVLLVIFMVAVPAVRNSIRVELPHGDRRDVASSTKDLVVTIDAREHVFINDTEVPLAELAHRIEKELPTARDKAVFISADKSLRYGNVFEIAVDRIKQIPGVSYVALISQRKRAGA